MVPLIQSASRPYPFNTQRQVQLASRPTHSQWIQSHITNRHTPKSCWPCFRPLPHSIIAHIMGLGEPRHPTTRPNHPNRDTHFSVAIMTAQGQAFITACLRSDHRHSILRSIIDEAGSRAPIIQPLVKAIQMNTQVDAPIVCRALEHIALLDNPTATTAALTALQALAQQVEHPCIATEALGTIYHIAFHPHPSIAAKALSALQALALQFEHPCFAKTALDRLKNIAIHSGHSTVTKASITILRDCIALTE